MRKKTAACHIVEHAWVARIAAWKLHTDRMAVTLGNRIYLWHADRKTFLEDDAWVRHELCHVQQFTQHGFVRFLFLYLLESMRHGYEGNVFERQAREAEHLETHWEDDMFASC